MTCDSRAFGPPCRIPSVLINLQAWIPASYDLDPWAHHNVIYAGRLGPEARSVRRLAGKVNLRAIVRIA